MNNAVTTHRWFHGLRAALRPTQADPADLGTAFGLDASFQDSSGAQTATPARARPGWLKRLAARGRRRP